MVDEERYVVVRKTDGREWIDIATLNFFPAFARKNAEQFDAKHASWAKENPIVRVAKVSLIEKGE